MDSLTREAAARLLARATDTRRVDASSFAARIRQSLERHVLVPCPGAAAQEIDGFFDSLHVDDLCLALACERGDEAAWVDFLRRYRPTVEAAARSACGTATAAGEITQSLWVELYGMRTDPTGDGRSGKLSLYSGCGPLGGWLRAVVYQTAAGWFRKTSRLVQLDAADDRGDLRQSTAAGRASADDPQRELEADDAARALCGVLFASLHALPSDDRLLLRLYYVEGLLLRQAGQTFGISEATASRRLGRLHQTLRRQVEATLRRERNWGDEETAHALAAAVPYLEGQLSKALEARPEPEPADGPLATRSRRGLT